jgi:hypothetical protein
MSEKVRLEGKWMRRRPLRAEWKIITVPLGPEFRYKKAERGQANQYKTDPSMAQD